MATQPQVPVWVGSQAITETPTSPRIEADATRFSVTRIYEGPYETLGSNQPYQGQAFSDLPPAALVVSVLLEKMPGGKGRLTVKAETSGPSETQPYAPLFEVEWVEVDRRIEQHPIYADGTDPLVFGGSVGQYALNIGDRTALQKWEGEDDFTLKAAYQFKILQTQPPTTPPDGYMAGTPLTLTTGVYDIYTLSTNAQNLAKKKLRGEDSYRLWAPVVRQTIQSLTLPAGDPCGKIEDPPNSANPPAGYVWQRSAQRGTKTGRFGKWTQQQEWQGADSIDTDLYTATGT
jgi:hypothetical protein